MDSFGQILRAAREAKNLTVEKVSDETAISGHFITALEKENIEAFPGEMYAIGFLRNYAEYLELDAARMISLLRLKKIQESPTPPELFAPPKRLRMIVIIIVTACFFTLGILLALWLMLKPADENNLHRTVVTDIAGEVSYRISAEPQNKRVYRGDKLTVPHQSGDITLEVSDTLGVLRLTTPIGDQFVELGEEIELDVDGNPGAEIIIFVSDISRTNAARGAEIRAMLKTETEFTRVEPAPIEERLPQGRTTVILDDTHAYPFVINTTFRSSCLLRYRTDRNDTIEDYYTNGDLLTLQANDSIRLWISNDTATKMQLVADGKNYDMDLSKLGRVIVCDVRWTRDNSNMYHLVVTELD
jgi:cytoskeletal protein RodZ